MKMDNEMEGGLSIVCNISSGLRSVRIYSGCNTEAHDGLTCKERDQAEDKLHHEWAATHDVKNCPACKTPIERSEATSPKGDDIYEHMQQWHGGIGLEFL
ncbi:hypothetical protein BD769DRAFT_1665748 [Suillus cothurnatus]|nr:hypothetical protein BD769DRAFT_1665748 [Suillus cothurnatus]